MTAPRPTAHEVEHDCHLDGQHITRLTLQVGAVDPRAPRLVLSVHEADQIEGREGVA